MNEEQLTPAESAAESPPMPDVAVPLPPEGYLDQLLAFMYTIAHWIGTLIVNLIAEFLTLETPASLVDPIGFLALLTVFLVITEIAKKLTWIVVVIGWVLIIARILLEIRP